MNRLFFKLLILLAILFASNSCNKINTNINSESTTKQTIETLKIKTGKKIRLTQKSDSISNLPICDIIISFENPISNNITEENIPNVGTYLNVESQYKGLWTVTQGLRIIGTPKGKKLRVLRTGKEKSSITFFKTIDEKAYICTAIVPEIPPLSSNNSYYASIIK